MPRDFRKALLSLILLCFAESTFAQSLQCSDPGSTMLWQVQGISNEVFLMGSIHVGRAEFYPLEPVVQEHFNNADNLVFEVDPRVLTNPLVALDIQRRGMLPVGETLADHVSPETLARLREVLAEVGLPAQIFMQMKPWMVTTMLSSLQVLQMGFNPQFGVENILLLAKPADSEILELESLEEQLGFLESMNSEFFLVHTLDGFGDESSDIINQMMDAWQCADHAVLNEVLNTEFEDPDMDAGTLALMDDLKETLLYNRNIVMAEGIQEFIKTGTGSYFVAVGAAHLLGERSVIDLLEDAGYTVTPVRQP